MIRNKLFDFQYKKKCTYLGIGPMSKNCVDVTIDLANKYECPFFLIASRRQIDSEQFGGGYVNNWTTEEFAKYVLEKNKKGNIYLCRDHGGPWQNSMEIEKKLNLEEAMDSAKNSYIADIKSGFKILHIDPSIDIFGKVSNEELVDTTEEVLFEGPAKKGDNMFLGRTRGNRVVLVKASPRLIGQFAKVRFERATASTLFGELVLEGVEDIAELAIA